MAMQKVTLIRGDGIGPEVVDAAIEVLDAAGAKIEWEEVLAGLAAHTLSGDPLPDEVLASIARNHTCLKGPVTTPIAGGFASINVALRKQFELYANLRPVRNMPCVASRFEGVDLVIIRENTEGLYSGLEHEVTPGVVESLKIATEKACTRIARFAFEYAAANQRKKITAIHKANIMKLTDGLFLRCAREVAREYGDLVYEEAIVDNASMQLVMNPARFDVLLLENLYGDILSDLCAGLVGGLGLVAGANLGLRDAIFEAVHGSAPDIAGQGVANPTAMLLACLMMLRYIGQEDVAARIQQALVKVYCEKRALTRDVGGASSTRQFAAAVIAALA